MPVEVIFPKVDMDMTSGTIADWHRAEGEFVEEGEALFDIETDKAAMEVESPGTGTLHFVSAHKGDEVPIGKVIAWLFADGEDVVTPAGTASPVEAMSKERTAAVQIGEDKDVVAPTFHEDVRATPLARRIAKDHGVALTAVAGTGPRGRITRADVEGHVGGPEAEGIAAAVPAATAGGNRMIGVQEAADDLGLAYDLIPVNRMRSVIAARLTEAKSTVPHFYLDADVRLDALLAFRGRVNAAGAKTGEKKVSINDILVRACALALKKVPEANASWDGDQIVRYQHAHISVAVAIDGGLVTPVVLEADSKGLRIVSGEIAELAGRAKAGKLSPDELKGGSFTISNLGMFGIKSFNAIINPPQSMILAVGQGIKQFVPDEIGNPKLATVMSVTLSCDHRVVDGTLGAAWLREFKSIVESPQEIKLI